MHMKKAAALLAIFLFMNVAWATEVSNLNIAINVNEDGSAQVTETYSLWFTSPFEENEFGEKAIENSSSVQAWQFDYSFFFPHFAQTVNNLSSSTISYDSEAKDLTFIYTPKENFATLTKQEQRAEFFTIDDRQFTSFNESGTIAIPENTNVTITLPQNSEIESENLPEKAIISGNIVSFRGIQSNSLGIDYRVLKPIAPSNIDIFGNISQVYFIIIPVVLVLTGIIYLRKEQIEERIEDYLVKHSEIKNRSPEEDINFDLESD